MWSFLDSEYISRPDGSTCGYDKKGGWGIDSSDLTHRICDSGHASGRDLWEETVDVFKDKDEDE